MTLVNCPQCNFRFDTAYGRIMVCSDCPSSTLGNCGYAKCPQCKHEFPLEGGQAEGQSFARRVA